MSVFTNLVQILTLVLALICLRDCQNLTFKKIDEKYQLVAESYALAENLFNKGRDSYNQLKNKSMHVIETFLDLVQTLNDEMSKEIRSAIVKFYKIKYFHDFTNYAISMEEIIDITEHCLIDPVEKLQQIRSQFQHVIENFQDVRNFKTVEKCANELPDEVATAHCVLHQAVLFNETMQESLVSIVEIKTRQHAQDMNSSIHEVHNCLNNFVPKFFDQLLVDAYTPRCGFMKVINASVVDLVEDDWRRHRTVFPKKWSPFVKIIKGTSTQNSSYPLFLTLFDANLTSNDVVKTLGLQINKE